MGRYGANEWLYAQPLADALVTDVDFRAWFLQQTVFSAQAREARLLWEEQQLKRTSSAENWWRSHFAWTRYPYLSECGSRETDLLAVFETPLGFRFALHIEVKAPGDKFRRHQALDYSRRASCWAGAGRAPHTVPEHDVASTVLCCPANFAIAHSADVQHFASLVTLEEIAVLLTPFPALPE